MHLIWFWIFKKNKKYNWFPHNNSKRCDRQQILQNMSHFFFIIGHMYSYTRVKQIEYSVKSGSANSLRNIRSPICWKNKLTFHKSLTEKDSLPCVSMLVAISNKTCLCYEHKQTQNEFNRARTSFLRTVFAWMIASARQHRGHYVQYTRVSLEHLIYFKS